MISYVLLAKLSTYGFDYNTLKLINSILSGRKFGTKIGSSYSPYLDLLVGVHQGSILGPLLFNIYMCDCETNIINYADGIPFELVNQIWTLNNLDNEIFLCINQFKVWKKGSNIGNIYKQVIKTNDFKEISKDYLVARLATLPNEQEIKIRLFNNSASYSVKMKS